MDTILSLYAGDGRTLLALNDDYSGKASRLVWTATSETEIYVRVTTYVGAATGMTATYQLSVTGEALPTPTPTATPRPGEPTPLTATPTPSPTPTRASLQATVEPSQPVTLTTGDGSTTIHVPAGSTGVTETVSLVYIPEPVPTDAVETPEPGQPTPTPTWTPVSGQPTSTPTPTRKPVLAFSLQMQTTSGQPVTQLSGTITVTIRG